MMSMKLTVVSVSASDDDSEWWRWIMCSCAYANPVCVHVVAHPIWCTERSPGLFSMFWSVAALKTSVFHLLVDTATELVQILSTSINRVLTIRSVVSSGNHNLTLGRWIGNGSAAVTVTVMVWYLLCCSAVGDTRARHCLSYWCWEYRSLTMLVNSFELILDIV
jgi:hypothetical protein